MRKVLVIVLALTTFGFAQRGSHGGGPPAGVGGGMGGGMGSGSSMGSGHGMSSDAGSMGHDQHQQGGQMQEGKTPSDILSKNTKLSSNLEKLLPSGTTAQQACSGFKNLGQCVAAIHVSHNLGISFDDLKAKMTGDGAESLGKAIGDLKPAADAKAEASKAQKQAKQDLKSS